MCILCEEPFRTILLSLSGVGVVTIATWLRDVWRVRRDTVRRARSMA